MPDKVIIKKILKEEKWAYKVMKFHLERDEFFCFCLVWLLALGIHPMALRHYSIKDAMD